MDTGKSFEMKLLQSALYFLAGLTSGVAIAISRRGNAGRARRSAQATSEGQQPMKMVLIVNTSLQMGKGKIAAQCAHAACGCVETAERSDAGRRNLRAWRGQGQKKIALATNQENLIRLERSLRSARHQLLPDQRRGENAGRRGEQNGVGRRSRYGRPHRCDH